jgi:hypothetical protein
MVDESLRSPLASQFIASDCLDGVTGRKGVIGYAQRQVVKNTDVGATLFWSAGIETSLTDALAGSERVRLQVPYAPRSSGGLADSAVSVEDGGNGLSHGTS